MFISILYHLYIQHHTARFLVPLLMAFRVSTLHTASGHDVHLDPALASDEALEDLRRFLVGDVASKWINNVHVM